MKSTRYVAIAAGSIAAICLGGAMIRGAARPKQAPPALGSRTVELGGQTLPGVHPHVQRPFRLPDRLIGGTQIGPMAAVQEPDGTVTVRGSADVIDRKRLQYHYAWLLRVYDGKRLVKERHYGLSALDPGETAASPGFVTNIDLQPGDYRIELSLYGIPPDFDRSKWAVGQAIRKTAGCVVSTSVNLTVH